MVLLADYEGLGVFIAETLWLLVTILAVLLAVGGIVAGAVTKPRRTLASWLGASACVIELGGVVIVCLVFADAQSRHPRFAEQFQPSVVVWIVSALTIAVGLAAVFPGLSRRGQSTSEESQSG
jgi:hypothetical protein